MEYVDICSSPASSPFFSIWVWVKIEAPEGTTDFRINVSYSPSNYWGTQ
jgi:hypothetical protein